MYIVTCPILSDSSRLEVCLTSFTSALFYNKVLV